MKKIILLVILSFTVTVTLFVRADGPATGIVRLYVENIEIDQKSLTLKIEGQLPNPCISFPTVSLQKTKNEGELLILVYGKQFGQTCIGMVGGPFAFEVDVRMLKEEIQNLELNPEESYTLITEDGEFRQIIDFARADGPS